MTIQEAREILQDEIKDLSDHEVQEMIDKDYQFCDALLDTIMSSPNILTFNEKYN